MRLECRRRLFLLLLLLVTACKTAVPPPVGEIPTAPAPEAVDAPSTAAPDADAAGKRRQAAAALTEQGRGLMNAGRIDPAMRLFEQALSLSPQYGPGYYFMAEAWLAKDNWPQAREFHRQAAFYLNADGAWKARVARQRARIERAAAAGIP